ncbi:Right handed beta helix region [Noviherbaspirillum humi]|uniref:Right handed beta helix region n=1 Tax=Noviherbaspirillum humi TaxID=1688639 RepID=A0A239HKW9_9BURK|nr:right-handed parallel beta-helix repeat-containing protein [Noviherbaspirillum humi]SNS82036.1 Right handed beta helix region [Noviherbaspirillum humi]
MTKTLFKRKARRHRQWINPYTAVALGVGIMAASVVLAVNSIDVPPRQLARYIEHRAAGHNTVVTALAGGVSKFFTAQDRKGDVRVTAQAMQVGAAVDAIPLKEDRIGARQTIFVNSSAEAIRAIAEARPGDAITFMPGEYRFSGTAVSASRVGEPSAPIWVRADRLGTVFLKLDMVEGFRVSAPHWRFENLNIEGTCQDHSRCEHAIHVVGKAHHFIARNNVISDFNAHIKINGAGADFPDHGSIEGNTLTNLAVRNTDNPVTPIDLVAASHWTIRRNLISDFVKAQGNQISYGAFVKGAGSHNRMEQNLVLCEDKLRAPAMQRVGLSLGGGGTGSAFCRDGRCITEQQESVIRENLIAHCSDDGIYLNKAAQSQVRQNVLIDTAGIAVRFAQSSAEISGNQVDGTIRQRDGALLRSADNDTTSGLGLFLGWHPVRRQFDDRGVLAGLTSRVQREDSDKGMESAARCLGLRTQQVVDKASTSSKACQP